MSLSLARAVHARGRAVLTDGGLMAVWVLGPVFL